MKKAKQQETNANRPSVPAADNGTDKGAPSLKRKQVPFVYIAMEEPADEYKRALASGRNLYRLVKIK